MRYNFRYNIEAETACSVGYAWFEAMHTRLDIVICNRSEADVKQACDQIYELVQDLSFRLNRHNPESEVSKLNREARFSFVPVSKELSELIEMAILANHETGGLFDIAIHSLNGKTSGANAIELVKDYHAVRFSDSDTQIDLGGIAKGYAVDQIKKLLLSRKVSDFMISFGNSSVAAHGNQPSQKGWKISLQDGSRVFNLQNECLSVSGNSELNPQHIVHPLKGIFVGGSKQYAVVTNTATEGDILSTLACLKES